MSVCEVLVAGLNDGWKFEWKASQKLTTFEKRLHHFRLDVCLCRGNVSRSLPGGAKTGYGSVDVEDGRRSRRRGATTPGEGSGSLDCLSDPLPLR